jgi:hypothetical protein
LLFLPGVGQGLVHDADGDLDAGGDGADGFPALAAGEDGGALVGVSAVLTTNPTDMSLACGDVGLRTPPRTSHGSHP